jgi:hypothetical protein
MVASKNAHADDGDRNRVVCRQEELSLAGCRKEIVNANAGKSICNTAIAVCRDPLNVATRYSRKQVTTDIPERVA